MHMITLKGYHNTILELSRRCQKKRIVDVIVDVEEGFLLAFTKYHLKSDSCSFRTTCLCVRRTERDQKYSVYENAWAWQ